MFKLFIDNTRGLSMAANKNQQTYQHLLHQLALRVVVALFLLFDIKNVFFTFSSKGKQQHPYIIVIDEHRRLTAGVIMSSEKKK